jgi:uncharacterized repeat protein (TIGR01451 family)
MAMARCAGHQLAHGVVVSLVMASVLTLGILVGLAPVRSVDAKRGDDPQITVSKSADNATITAGEAIGFTITLTNTNTGQSDNVTLTDVLPSLPSAPVWTETTGNPACTIAANTLSCNFGTLSFQFADITLHVAAITSQIDCPVSATNTANLTYVGSDDGDTSESPSATVTIDCPTPTPVPTETATVIPPTETATAPPTETATTAPTETTLPATEAPTSTATREATGNVSELPSTGGGPGGESGQSSGWLVLLVLVVVSGAALTRFWSRQRR